MRETLTLANLEGWISAFEIYWLKSSAQRGWSLKTIDDGGERLSTISFRGDDVLRLTCLQLSYDLEDMTWDELVSILFREVDGKTNQKQIKRQTVDRGAKE